MKKVSIKLFFLTILILLFPIMAMAADSGKCGENVTWNIADNVLTISGSGNMTDYSSSADVPWYLQQSEIKSVIINDGVTSIGTSAFEGCIRMTDVAIPDSVTKIGARAFCQCFELTNITIPKNITEIEENTFCWCRKLTSVEIPNGVTSIKSSAFAQCKNLANIKVPSTVIDIADSAFGECSNLKDVDYIGSHEKWNYINIGQSNTYLTNADVHYMNSKSVLIQTVPYAKVTVNGNTQSSGNSGIVRANITSDTISYKVEKNGYKTVEENNVTVSSNNSDVYVDNGNTVVNLDGTSGIAIGVAYGTNGKLGALKTAEIENGKATILENIEADKVFVWNSLQEMIPQCNPITVSSNDGLVLNIPLSLDENVLYAENFENAANIQKTVGKNQTVYDVFGITAGYGNVDLSTANGELSVTNTDKNSFRSVSYPLNVTEKDTEVSMDITFPDAESQIIVRDTQNNILGAIHRAGDGKVTFGASGEKFAGTESVGVQSSPLGTVLANTKVTVDFNIDITNGNIIAEIGDRAAGVSGYTGNNGVGSIFIGTTAGNTVKADNIEVRKNTGTEAVIAKFVLNTTPYAKAIINDGVYYSGATGKIETEYITINSDTHCPINYTIEKGGYETVTNTVNGTSSGTEINAELNINDGLLYAEDFDTVSTSKLERTLQGGEDSVANEMFGISAVYGPITLTADNEKLSLSNSANGFRMVSYPLDIQSANSEVTMDVTFPNGESNIALRDSANQILGAIHRAEDGTVTFGASGRVYNTSNAGVGVQSKSLGTITAGENVTIDITIDVANGIIKASIGDETATVSGYKKSSDGYDDLSSIFIGTARGAGKMSIDNIKVKEYAGTEIPMAKFKLTTTPYAKATINDEVYYSGATGIVEMSMPITEENSTVNYTIEKGGYVTKNGEENISEAGLEIEDLLDKEEGVLYSEDFETISDSKVTETLLDDSTADLFGITAKYKTITLTAENGKLSLFNTGGGVRSVSYPINVPSSGTTVMIDVTFPDVYSHIILRDNANKILAAIRRDDDGTVTFGASGENYNSSNKAIDVQSESLGTVEAGTPVSVIINLDTANGNISATIGDETATISGYSNTADVNSIFIGTAKNRTIIIDKLLVKETVEE